MPVPFLVAQLSDPHIGGDWGGEDPVAGLRGVVDDVRRQPDRPDVLLVTGDLTDHGTAAEYATVRELLEPVGVPVYVIPGNHDDRAALRAAFGLPGTGAEPVQYAVDLGPLRLACIDTTIPGRAPGALDAARLGLAGRRAGPRARASRRSWPCTIPRSPPGSRPWDAIGLPPGDRAALAAVLERHPQVRRVVAGHVHQVITGSLAQRPVLTIPSTYVQARLDFTSPEIELGGGAPGFARHALLDGEIASYVHTSE